MQKPISIPPWPPRDVEIDQAIGRLLADGSWGAYSGPATNELRERLSAYFGRTFVGLCSSGTIGVEIALRAAGVESGDEVILAAYDFPGNFRAIELIGAVPVLVDLLSQTHVIDPSAVEEAISPLTRAIIASHLHGQIAPIERLMSICQKHGVLFIEDACQVPGATSSGKRLGSFGDIGVLSFGGSKLLTAGRGGALLTDNESLHQRARIFCDRGNDAFPMSELQAAVLNPQLDRLDQRNATRQKAVEILMKEFHQAPDLTIPIDPVVESAFYKVPFLYSGSPSQKATFIDSLVAQGIEIGEGFRGFALRSARRCRKIGSLSNVQRQVAETCLLHHPLLLSDDDTVRDAAARITTALRHSKNVE